MAEFSLGNHTIEVLGKIEQKRAEYPLCDEKGSPVSSERETGKTTYKNSEGVIVSKTYRLIGGKPYDKFKKTSRVSVFQEVPRVEAYDLIGECCYLCRNKELKEQLQKNDTALKFIYTSGNGYKAYISYLCVYQNRLVMFLGFGSILQQIQAIESNKVEEVNQEVVEKANPEQLLLAEIKV